MAIRKQHCPLIRSVGRATAVPDLLVFLSSRLSERFGDSHADERSEEDSCEAQCEDHLDKGDVHGHLVYARGSVGEYQNSVRAAEQHRREFTVPFFQIWFYLKISILWITTEKGFYWNMRAEFLK